MILVYRYRVKSLNGLLNTQARAVNFVWNYCNDRQKDALRFRRKWLTGYDLIRLTSGSYQELGLLSRTISAVCDQYVKSRSQRNRPFLRYRGKKALGWIPISAHDLKREGDAFRLAGRTYRVFSSRPLPDGKIKDGSSFSQDTQGNWYLNIVIDVPGEQARMPLNGVGIDLGLKDFATLSTGEKIEAQRIYRGAEQALAIASRAHKKRRIKAIQAKTANRRADFLHKLSTRIVREFDYIAVGNVNAAGLTKTRLAKSVNDAGWTNFRRMLAYKSVRNGAWFEEVDERFTTQLCSDCSAVSGPQGTAQLGIRNWICRDCGRSHDRDVNSARNILSKFSFGSGHRTPAEGASRLRAG